MKSADPASAIPTIIAAALLFSLYPGKILTWVGKILNPCFLVFLGILVIVAMLNPSASISSSGVRIFARSPAR